MKHGYWQQNWNKKICGAPHLNYTPTEYEMCCCYGKKTLVITYGPRQNKGYIITSSSQSAEPKVESSLN